jgi:2-iminobutanoate/2-iminopropanoate deaminase
MAFAMTVLICRTKVNRIPGEVQMRKQIHSDRAPKAVGPYAPGVLCDDTLYVSGQIPLDPASGTLAAADIRTQTRRVLENLKAVIEAAGFTLADTVKCSCFLINLEHFGDFNAVYGEYFGEILPARETVQVARLPRDALLEVSAVCRRG